MTGAVATRRILVIGASGFLGAHIRRRLATVPGAEVITAGRGADGDGGAHLQLDLGADGAPEIAAKLTKIAPDVVVNCAGAVGGGPEVLAAGNIVGIGALVEAMLRARRGSRLIHLGSAAEYGRVEPGTAVREQDPACPLSVYGVTKLAGTAIVRAAWAAGLDAAVLRVFNPIGPGSPPSSLPGRLIAELARAQADDGVVRLGPLDAVRDFVDVRDLADAVALAAVVPVLIHPVLNAGSGRAIPVRALVDELRVIAGFAGEVREDAAGSARSADVPWMQADLATATEALGWRPRFELTTSLRDAWKAAT